MGNISSYFEPATLHRYRSLENIDRELLAIKEATLYLSPYNKLNDPMEGRFSPIERLKGGAKYESLMNQTAKRIEALGICSFSETHDNEIMWAHYANDFSGICVAYRFARLRSKLDEDTEFIRLSYQDKAPTIPQSKTPEYLAKRVLSCKSYRWLYEREWRAFGKKGLISYGNVNCVQTVYLGARIDSAHRKRIVHEMKTLEIRCRAMSLEKYLMTFTDCA